MAEQTQVKKVTRKDPKKVEQGKRLAEWNRQNRKAQKSKSKPKLTSSQYYGAGVIVAIRVLGIIDYYVYLSKTHKETSINQTNETLVHQLQETPAHKFEMD